MELIKPRDLLEMIDGSVVSKRNLFDLIQYSKVEGSQHWEGEGSRIGNTPQQGINWLGELPTCQAVLIKTKHGSYAEDGWQDAVRSTYHYSLKAIKDEISYTEKANLVLLKQPEHGYPILLFAESGPKNWLFEGRFDVTGSGDRYVVLKRRQGQPHTIQEERRLFSHYLEGARTYIRHLRTERNQAVVTELKATRDCVCDICGLRPTRIYGVECIEAHHTVPISSWESERVVTVEDFVLLCPSCHSAVHKVSGDGKQYAEARAVLLSNFEQAGYDGW